MAPYTVARSSRTIHAVSEVASLVLAHGPGGQDMLFIAILCLVLWLLGVMTTTTLGGVLHILLVVAVILFLVHIIQGRPIGNA